MTDPIISRDAIKAQARRAAEAGKGPEACPYLPGSVYAEAWKDAFYVYVSRLDSNAQFQREASCETQ